jgi:succinyl-diaminopimelate desuccinylase
VARIEGNNEKLPICLAGHLDTVPLGAVPWDKNPFTGETDGNKIYGRGSSDMKGGIAAIITAALRLSDNFKNSSAGLTLVIVAGEETGCHGSSHLASLGDALGKAGAVIVGEPTSNYPFIGNKATLWIEAITSGVAAHGATPEKGVNAIYKAAEVVTKLERFDFGVPAHPYLGKPTLNVGTVSGGLNFNSVPDKTSIGIDIRTIPGLTNRQILEKLQSYLGRDVELKRVMDISGMISDPQDDWIQQVFHIMERFLKKPPQPRAIKGFTDASILTPAFGNPPTIILGPGEPNMAHKTDEFCYISKIEEAVDAYMEIIKAWCNL